MDNHLVIGLGGTGCDVIRELHKRLTLEHNPTGGSGFRPPVYEFTQGYGELERKARIATLSVDSDMREHMHRDSKWKIPGGRLTLHESEYFEVRRQLGLEEVLCNLQQYPGIAPWLASDVDLIRERDSILGKFPTCDQVRPMGRVALAGRTNSVGFFNRIMLQLNALRQGNSNSVAIHVCASLAGGTGGGILMDTIAQLRKELEWGLGNFPIYLYTFICSEDVYADTGNFHANQYGALVELNALRRGSYRPWDVSNQTQSVRLDVADPFEACFLVSGVSENGIALSLETQVRSVAEFLTQKFARMVGDIPWGLQQAHNFEFVMAPPHIPDHDMDGQSMRFSSFGVKRFGIPDAVLRRKLALTFAEQGLLGLIFANWQPQIGFACVGRSGAARNLDEYVTDFTSALLLSARHLNMDLHPDHQSYAEEWNSIAATAKQDTMVPACSFMEWTAVFRDHMYRHCETGFRGTGVDLFFLPREAEDVLRQRAMAIAENFEGYLLKAWLTPHSPMGVDDLSNLVRLYRDVVENDRAVFRRRLEELPAKINEVCDLGLTTEECLTRIGPLQEFFSKRRGVIFETYVTATRNYFELKTEERAAGYAVRLIERLLPLLDSLGDQVERVNCVFKELARKWLPKEMDRSHLFQQDFFDYVNNHGLHTSFGWFVRDRQAMSQQSEEMRWAIAKYEPIHFGFILNKLCINHDGVPYGSLWEQWEQMSYVISNEVHTAHEQRGEPGFVPILRVNLLKKLCDDHQGVVSGELRSQLSNVLTEAMPALAFDAAAPPVEHLLPSPVRRCTILIPQCAALVDSGFRDLLCDELSAMAGGMGRIVEIFDVPEECNTSEIVFLSTTYFFPLRIIRPIARLKECFDVKLKRDQRRAKFFHFSQTHQEPLPDLFPP